MTRFLWKVRVQSPFSKILFWMLTFTTLDAADTAGVTTAPWNHTVQLSKQVPPNRWSDGNPTKLFSWVQENSVGKGNRLHFDSTRFTNKRWYTCVAEPGIGDRAHLDIVGKESRLISGNVVILNEKFDHDLMNKESEKYQNFSKRFAQVVEDLFKANINYCATKVIQFESGCVKVYFKLELKRIVRASIMISALKHAAMDGKFGNFIVDPSSITVSQDEMRASSSKNSTGNVKASLWVALPLIVLVLVVIYVVCCRSKQNGTRERQTEVQGETTSTVVPLLGDGNHEMYDVMRKKSDGTLERQMGVRGDNVYKLLGT